MKSLLLTASFTFAFPMFSMAMAEPSNEEADTVLIPLDEIWAYNMPGTRDVRELEPDNFGDAVRKRTSAEQSRRLHASLTYQIRQALQPPQLQKPGPVKQPDTKTGFAVMGTGVEALRQAHSVLVRKRRPDSSFPLGTELSVVFTSNQFNRYVHLDSVKRLRNVIEIRYRFVPHMTKEMTDHFALVPLGGLPIGQYRVEMIQSPLKQKFTSWNAKDVAPEVANRIVSGSFSFSVSK